MKTLIKSLIIVLSMVVINVTIAENELSANDSNIKGGLPEIGYAFNYQGELIDSGSPASGTYDFSFRLYTAASGGVPSSVIVDKTLIVTNGLFNTNLDFGANPFIGSEQWLEIKVKPSSGGSYSTLSPLQRINATPYAIQAEFLAANGASSGDVLKYNGVDWIPSNSVPHAITAGTASALNISGATNGDVLQYDGSTWVANAVASNSPWTDNGSYVSYPSGKVTIGSTVSNAMLLIDAAAGSNELIRVRVDSTTKFLVKDNGGTVIGSYATAPTNGLRVEGKSYFKNDIGVGITPQAPLHIKDTGIKIAEFDGGDRSYIFFKENGLSRGYIGSYQNPATTDINNEDFEIGTNGGSSGSLHIVTGNTNPRITVTSDGKVGVNELTPSAKFEIQSDGANENPLVVKTGSSAKLVVNDNGGTSIGFSSTPPVNGLKVNGNVKQPLASNGMIKYMVHANCSTPGSIIKSYNGIQPDNVIDPITASTSGSAQCSINFPTNINGRFWQVSTVSNDYSGFGEVISARCFLVSGDNDTLHCDSFYWSTSLTKVAKATGEIMIMVY